MPGRGSTDALPEEPCSQPPARDAWSPIPAAVLIRTAAGEIIGAVGISGDTSDRDEACAIAGIEAAGLKADPGQDAS